MKRVIILSISFFILFLLIGCAEKPQPEKPIIETKETIAEEPEAKVEKVEEEIVKEAKETPKEIAAEKMDPDMIEFKSIWKEINEDSPYKEWSFWPDHKGLQDGKSPHGPKHYVYVNEAALKFNRIPLNDNSIIVKENLSENEELLALTIMKKKKGYNPAAGDWFWAKVSPDGKPEKIGKPKECIDCHKVKEDNDFIMVHELPKESKD